MLNTNNYTFRKAYGKAKMYSKHTIVYTTNNDHTLNDLLYDSWCLEDSLYTGPTANIRDYNSLKPEYNGLLCILNYLAVYGINDPKKLKIQAFTTDACPDAKITELFNNRENYNHNHVVFIKHKFTNTPWDDCYNVGLSKLLTDTARVLTSVESTSARIYKKDNIALVCINKEPCWEVVYPAMVLLLKQWYPCQDSYFIRLATLLTKHCTYAATELLCKEIIEQKFENNVDIKKLLDEQKNKAFQKFFTPNLNAIKDNITSQKRLINDYETKMLNALTKLREFEYTYAGATNIDVESKIKEFLEFKDKLKNCNIELNTDSMTLFIEAPITQYDIDAYNRCVAVTTRKILDPIFKTNEYKLICYAAISFTSSGSIDLFNQTQTAKSYWKDHYNDLYPHPHIVRHNCLGNNATEIKKAIIDRDIKKAVIASIAAVQNQNFTDNTVNRTFTSDFLTAYTDKKCILTKEGERITIKEYMSRINKEVSE